MAETDRKHVGTLVLEGLLVVLAFVGIVLFLGLWHSKWLIPAGIGWGLAALVVLFVVVRRAARSRAEGPLDTRRHGSSR